MARTVKKKQERRVQCSRTVKPSTVRAIKRLARRLDISEGKVLDRAVVALVSAEVNKVVANEDRV